MPGPQAHRLEAFEDRDVLCGVRRLWSRGCHRRKSPAKHRLLRAAVQCIRPGGRGRPSRAPNSALFAHFRGGSRRRSAPRSTPLRRACSGVGSSGRGAGGRSAGSGSGPGANRTAGDAEARGDLGRAVAELERPDRVRGVDHVQRPVAGDPRRPGVPRDRRRRRRPASARRGRPRPACGPKRDELARGPSQPSLSRGHLHHLAGSTGKRERCVAVITACSSVGDAARRARRGGGASSSESTSSSSRSGGAGEQLRLGEEKREERQPLLALRAEAAQVAVAGERCGRRRGAARARSRRARCPRRDGRRARRRSAAPAS